MTPNRILRTIESNTFGEGTRIIDGGLLKLKGDTLLERRNYLVEHYDYIRTACVCEPRGHRDLVGALLIPPCNPEADFGVYFMDNKGYHNMCGHGTIGVSAAVVEAGMVEMTRPVTKVVLETVVGLVEAYVKIGDDGLVESVSFENIPSFLLYKDAEVDVPEIGKIKTDIVYGGNYYGFVASDYMGLKVDPKNSKLFKHYGALIKKAINETLDISHPALDFIHGVDNITFYSEPTLPGADVKNVHYFADGQLDRSPGGTASCAWVARRVGRGEMKIGEEFVVEGLAGVGTFIGTALENVKIGDVDAVRTRITGRAFITGFQTIVIDPRDPAKYGFVID